MTLNIGNDHPQLVAITAPQVCTVDSNTYDPAAMTAAVPATGTAVNLYEVTRLQSVAGPAVGRRAGLVAVMSAFITAYNNLNTTVGQGTGALVGTLRTQIPAYSQAEATLMQFLKSNDQP